jgi:putative ABC transport system permease protein
VADAVDATLNAGGVEVASAASISRREAIGEGHLGPIITIVKAIAVAIGVIGTIGLASTMSTNILDRTREFGVMQAIGARPEHVRRIVTAEGIVLGFASVVVAVIPTVALTAVLGAGLGNLFFSAPPAAADLHPSYRHLERYRHPGRRARHRGGSHSGISPDRSRSARLRLRTLS